MRKRAFIIGTLLSAGIAMYDPYLMIKGVNVYFCWEYWAPAAIFAIFFLLLLSSLSRLFELSSKELMLVFVMASTASVLPSMGFVSSLIPIISGFTYFATPANMWVEKIINKTPSLLMVKDTRAITWFYEGLPHGEAIPYGPWIAPMSFILLFVLVFSFLSICLMVLFRKQWVEKERLTYPLTILPLEMIKKEKGSKVPLLLKNRLFWLSFSIVFLYYFFNWLTRRTTGSQMLSMTGYIHLFRKTTGLNLNPDFPILGLAYLIPRSVSLSLWLFHVIFTIQNGFLNISGFKLPGINEPYGGRSTITSFEGAGAMLLLVIALFWRARQHLSDCFGKAFGRRKSVDDSGELFSYRTAVFGAIISFILTVFFMHYSGMPWIVAVAFVIFSIVVFLGISRIVCQAGLPAARAMCIPTVYTSYLLPPSLLTDQGYLALGLQHSWAADIRTSVMATTGHSLRIQDEVRMPSRLLLAGIITSIVVSYVASSYVHINSAYRLGALNASVAPTGGSSWFFGGGLTRFVANFVLPKIENPITREIMLPRYIFTGIGAFLMGALMFLHSKFLWWPVHYIGFPIAESAPLQSSWFAIFLAWLIKGLILKFGGHNVYRKSVPFFLGMIVAYVTWLVVQSVVMLILVK